MANYTKGIGPHSLGSAFKQTKKPSKFSENLKRLKSDIESGSFDISPSLGYYTKTKKNAYSYNSGTSVGGGDYGKKQKFDKYSDVDPELEGNLRNFVLKPGANTLASDPYGRDKKRSYNKKVYNDKDTSSVYSEGGFIKDKKNVGKSIIVSDHMKKLKELGKARINYKKGDLLDAVDVVSKIKYGSGSGGGETYKDTPQYKELMNKVNKESDNFNSYSVNANKGNDGSLGYGFLSATNPSTGRDISANVNFTDNKGPKAMFTGTQTMMERFQKRTGNNKRQKFQYKATNAEGMQTGSGRGVGQVGMIPLGSAEIINKRGTTRGTSGFSDYLTEKLNFMQARSADTTREDLKGKSSSNKKKQKAKKSY